MRNNLDNSSVVQLAKAHSGRYETSQFSYMETKHRIKGTKRGLALGNTQITERAANRHCIEKMSSLRMHIYHLILIPWAICYLLFVELVPSGWQGERTVEVTEYLHDVGLLQVLQYLSYMSV